MEDCKWNSDPFQYICCNADNCAHVAEWCPYDGCHEMCDYYEPKEGGRNGGEKDVLKERNTV